MISKRHLSKTPLSAHALQGTKGDRQQPAGTRDVGGKLLCSSDGTDLAAALYAQIERSPPRPRPALINRDMIALFPNEIIRSPSSSYFSSCQHDVPWEEPELVRGVLNQMRRIQIRRQARRFAERHLPAVVGGLVRVGLLDAGAATDTRRPLAVMSAPLEGITPPL